MNDVWITDLVAENLDFDRYGGKDRVRACLQSGEVILHAAHGWFEEGTTSPNSGRRREGLIAITNERVLVVRTPGLLSKNPPPISVPFNTTITAGEHVGLSNVVVLGAHENGSFRPCFFHLGRADRQPKSLAATFGFAIKHSAEAAGGPQTAPPELR